MLKLLSILVVFTALVQCVKAQPLRIPTNEVSIQEGKRIYILTCVKCHNANPNKPGSIGPDLFSTPKNVFEQKVPYGKYPSGYSPKRRTRVMQKFPHLTNKVEHIYNYIQTFKDKK